MKTLAHLSITILMVVIICFSPIAASSQTYTKAIWFSNCPESYCEVTEFNHPGGDQLTVSTWVKAETLAGNQKPHATLISLADKNVDPNLGAFWLKLDSSNTYIEFVLQTQFMKKSIKSTTAITDQNWHHVTCIYDGTSMYLYLNGTIEAVRSINGFLNISPCGYSLQFGSWGHPLDNYRRFTGALDDISIWNRPLGVNEVFELMYYPYNLINGPNNSYDAENLLGFWSFDEMINSSLNLTGLSGSENLGSNVNLAYTTPKHEVFFYITSNSQPYNGYLKIGETIKSITNGSTSFLLTESGHNIKVYNPSMALVNEYEIETFCQNNYFPMELNSQPNTFYSNNNPDFNNTNTWNSKRDGSGIAPTSLASSSIVLVIQNNHCARIIHPFSSQGTIIIENGAELELNNAFINLNTLNLQNGSKLSISENFISLNSISHFIIAPKSLISLKHPVAAFEKLQKSGILSINFNNPIDTLFLSSNLEVRSFLIHSGVVKMHKTLLSITDDFSINQHIKYKSFITTDQSILHISGSSQNPVILPDLTLGELRLYRESGIILDGNISINNLYLCNGKIFTNNSAVIIPEGGKVFHSHNFSYVCGQMVRFSDSKNPSQPLFFPIGDQENFRPLHFSPIQKNNSSSGYSFSYNTGLHHSAYYLPEFIENINSNRFLSFQSLNKTNLVEAQISLAYGRDDNVINPESITLAIFDNGEWTDIGGKANSELEGTIESSFSGYIKGDIVIANTFPKNEPLPVSLLSFHGKINNNSVRLTWETACEINNQGFSILKSNDGVNYQEIGFMNGNGTCSNLSSYIFDDTNLQKSFKGAYYKLHQKDYDGKIHEYNPVFVPFQNNNSFSVTSIFFNQSQQLEALITSEKDNTIEIAINSIDGKTLHTGAYEIVSGSNIINIPNDFIPKFSVVSFHTNNEMPVAHKILK